MSGLTDELCWGSGNQVQTVGSTTRRQEAGMKLINGMVSKRTGVSDPVSIVKPLPSTGCIARSQTAKPLAAATTRCYTESASTTTTTTTTTITTYYNSFYSLSFTANTDSAAEYSLRY